MAAVGVTAAVAAEEAVVPLVAAVVVLVKIKTGVAAAVALDRHNTRLVT